MHITVDTIIGDILRQETEAAVLFREAGMHCIECPAARGETVAEACAVPWYGCRAVRSSI